MMLLNMSLCKGYQNGIGLPKDDAKGAYWYRKAALQGHARAQHNLGFCKYFYLYHSLNNDSLTFLFA